MGYNHSAQKYSCELPKIMYTKYFQENMTDES